MNINNRVEKAVFCAIDEWNNDDDQTIILAKEHKTQLLGGNSSVDSLGIINILIAIEEQIDAEFNIYISLATEEAMKEEESPFNTVGSIIRYASRLVEKEFSNT